MNHTKNLVIISVILALIIISCIIFVPAVLKANKEDNVAAALSEIYNDQFVVTKSTVPTFGDEFEITVQSETSNTVYNFDVKGEEYEGEYFAQNVNVQVNELIQPIVGEEALVMSNVFQEGLQSEATLDEVDVEKATIHLLVRESLSDDTAQQIANTLKAQFGEIAITVEVYVVDEPRVFEGVKTEVSKFFQLSEINAKSFVDFQFDEQSYKF